ncbi:MAG TPA: hypothetical protein VFL36_04835 [Myxococcales bacterium]|nr:hypothetical protein [Myxococcales bacterium]
MSKRILECLVLASLSAGPLWAGSDPFVGKWKLDTAHSHFTDQMRVESDGANQYRFSFDGTNVETIVADGTEQPGLSGTNLSVSVEDTHTWKVVRKKNGRMLLTATWKLSRDGRTLRDTFTSFQPDGSPATVNNVYERTAGTSGFPGTWEDTHSKFASAFEIQIQPYRGNGLSFVTPAQGTTRNVEFDGNDHANGIAPGLTTSGRRVNEHTLALKDKTNGKLDDTREISLSRDGKTLTITVHQRGRTHPSVLVFARE